MDADNPSMKEVVLRCLEKVEAGATWRQAVETDPACYYTPEGVMMAAKRLGLYRLSDMEKSKREMRELADEMLERIESKRAKGIPLGVTLREIGLSRSQYMRAKDRAGIREMEN